MPTGISSQPEHEQRRQKQEEDDAEVGIVVGPAEQFDQPVADHGHAGGAGDGAAGKADGVVAEKQRRPHPVFTESLKQAKFPQTGKDRLQ